MKANKKKIMRGRPFEGDNDLDSSGKQGGGGGKSKPPFSMKKRGGGAAAVTQVKSRKELRKTLRKAKKAQKHQYLLVKCGRADLVQKADDESTGKKKKKRKKNKKKKKGNKSEEILEGDGEESVKTEEIKVEVVGETSKKWKKERLDPALELRKEEELLKKEMEVVRRKRLIEENEEEERNIKQLSKKLKLNKKANIPASFRTDGLDYVLEICEQTSGGKKKLEDDSDEDMEDEGDEDGGDSASDLGTVEEDLDESDEEELDGEEDADNSEEDGLDAEIFGSDEEDDGLDSDEAADENMGDKDSDNSGDEQDTDKDKHKIAKAKKKTKEKKEDDDGVWEDIYGRMRSKDGAVLINNGTGNEIATAKPASTGKYVPPMMRGNQAQREKIAKQLKGLLNRLSESNMHSIANQMEEMYMANSRNEMNQTLLELLTSALVRPAMMPERVVLEHIMLIAILHANVGTEVGAFFIQSFTQYFKSKYDAYDLHSDDENKELENLSLIVSFIYHFKIVDACLIYDILKLLGESFKSKDIEIILTILRSIGFRLRKDDPAALKELIITLQQKASKLQTGESGSAKVKFMLEILLAIRNNNMNKIPNYDPSFGEHLQKIIRSHLHPGTYVSEMKIGLKDLLNVDKAGRWWIVGSAWTGKQSEEAKETDSTTAQHIISSEDAAKHAKLLKRARAQGMNTDARRNIFCILMTAEDYLDAFEKLNHLDLRNNQDREIIHVCTYCCLQEKIFNPYYAFIVSKFSTTDRKLMYPSSFKEEVRYYAEALGQRTASRLFSISQKRIFDWISDAKCIPDSSTRKRAAVLRTRRRNLSKIRKSLVYYTGSMELNHFHQPQPSIKEIDAKVETEIREWIKSQDPRTVPSTEVRQKAKDIYRKHGRMEIECSYGWYRRFKARMMSTNGPNTGYKEDDNLVLTWLLQVYDNNDLISYKDLQCYAQNAFQEIKPEFKASAGWAMRFLKRYHAVINWDGIYLDPLPPALECQVDNFRVQMKASLDQFSTKSVGCMDEIPLNFTNPTLGTKATEHDPQPVSRLRKYSIKNCDATVILGFLADGTLLPPMVIVKGQLNSSIDQVYNTPNSSVVAYYSSTTEPSLSSIEKWLDLIWLKNVRTPNCLIADSYKVHQHLIEKCNSNSAASCLLIPNGCSLKLNPLNVLVKHIFMENMEKLWQRYLTSIGDECGKKIRLPTTNEIVDWVQQSYEVTNSQSDKLSQSFQRVIEG